MEVSSSKIWKNLERRIQNGINKPTMTLIQVWAIHTQRQTETARNLAVETWLQRNSVITITQNKKVLPVFREQLPHN
jgi:hypothetical protein